jgi:hypothetical protein
LLASGCLKLGGDLAAPFADPSVAAISVTMARSATAPSRTVTLSVFYRSAGTVVALARSSATVGGGSTTLPINVDVARCLADATIARSAPSVCPLQVAISVRDEVGVLVDSTTVGPIDAQPGTTVTSPTVSFDPPRVLDVPRFTVGLAVGDTQTLSAIARDATGAALPPGGIRWESSDPAIVAVDSISGRATAVAIGRARVRVRRAGLVDSLSVGIVRTAANTQCRGTFDLLNTSVQRDTTIGGPGRRVRAFNSSIVVAGGTLRVASGTTLCFDVGGITALQGGTVQAIGTASQPIRMQAIDTLVGWSGITLTDVPVDSSRFTFVELRHALRNNFAVIFQQYLSGAARHPVRLEDVVIGSTNMRAIWANESRGGILVRRVTVESAADSVIQPEFSNAAVGLTDSAVVEDLTIRRSGANGLFINAFAPSVPSGVRLRDVSIAQAALSGLVVNAGTKFPRATGLRITSSGGYPIELPATALGLLPADSAGYAALSGNVRDTIRTTFGALSSGDSISMWGPIAWRFDGALQIPEGSLVAMRSGVRVAFASLAGIFINGGGLQISGTSAAPVRLSALDTLAGWKGINSNGAKLNQQLIIDRAVISYTSGVMVTAPVGPQVPAITRSIFRRFTTAAVFSPVGAIVEDCRFERPIDGPGAILVTNSGSGAIFELRRSILNGAGTQLSGLRVQPATGSAIRVVVDSVTIDSVGGRGIDLGGTALSPSLLTLRAINLTHVGQQALKWDQAGAPIAATRIWWGAPSAPPSAANALDASAGSIWNPALITVLPVATSPHIIPEPPVAPAIAGSSSARVLLPAGGTQASRRRASGG